MTIITTPTGQPAQPEAPPRGSSTADGVCRMIRVVGAIALAAAAAVVLVVLPPEPVSSEADIMRAVTDAKVNKESAISAAQQNVVNGWVNRDLLAIIAGQADRSLDQRPVAMLLLGVLGLCLGLATTPSGSGPAATRPGSTGDGRPTQAAPEAVPPTRPGPSNP